jgi:NTE family protein
MCIRSTRICLLLVGLSAILFGCQSKYQSFPEPVASKKTIQFEKTISLALVLGGGGARGMAHLGVIEALEEAGIKFDLIVGCSAGSIVGALYADNPDAKKLKSVLAPLNKWDFLDYDLFQSQYGVGKGTSMSNLLLRNLEVSEFKDLKVPLVVVATDLKNGELVAIDQGPIAPAVRASAAIPGYFEPVELDGRVLVDGAVVNQVPVVVARNYKAELIIAVDINESLPEDMPTNFVGVAKRCMEIKFLHHNQACLKGADFVIKPDVAAVGMFCDDSKWEVYQAGRKAALEMIPQIIEAINIQWESQNHGPSVINLSSHEKCSLMQIPQNELG